MATADGQVAIDDLAIGDSVLAYDEATGVTGSYTVTAVLAHLDPTIVHLTIDGEPIETTPEHPFFVENKGWTPAGYLMLGDQVRQAGGMSGVVQRVAVERRSQPMYNLTVAVAHTFFVGEGQWLVHNTCSLGGRYKDLLPANGSEIHHMPADSISPLSTRDGPAIRMDPADHRLTASWGNSRLAQAYRAAQKGLIDLGRFDDAIQMDIDDVVGKFGNKYDTHILQMIDSLK